MAILSAPLYHPPAWETVAEVLAHYSKIMRENASFLVIFV
jgi:hypothetical protein